jgi:hypothetical protein
MSAQNRPTKSYRCGAVSAAIWPTPVDGGTDVFHSVTLQRRYRGEDGEWKDGALRYQDLPAAIRLLQRAMAAIEGAQESGNSLGLDRGNEP